MAKRKPLEIGDFVTVHMPSFPEGGKELGVCQVTSLHSGNDSKYVEVAQAEIEPLGKTWHHHEEALRRSKPPVRVVFKQDCPADQLVSIIQAIEGNRMNLEKRISKRANDSLRLQVACLQQLHKHLAGVPWNPNESLNVKKPR